MAVRSNNHTVSGSSLTSPIYIVEDKVTHDVLRGQGVAGNNFTSMQNRKQEMWARMLTALRALVHDSSTTM